MRNTSKWTIEACFKFNFRKLKEVAHHVQMLQKSTSKNASSPPWQSIFIMIYDSLVLILHTVFEECELASQDLAEV